MAVKELKMEVRNSGATFKEFAFSVSADELKQVTNSVAAELANYVSIPGFRKGKAPAAMVIKKYNSDVKNEVMRKLIALAFSQIEADKTLDILNCSLAEPPQEFELDKDFQFVLKAQIAPEISLPDYKEIRVDVAAAAVTDEEVNEKVEYYRNMYGTYAEVEGPAVADDMLKVSYTSDFVLPENPPQGLARTVASDDNYLWLNDPELIPGSIKALTGAKVGEEYSFAAEFPADWRDADLSGKTVNYNVKVHGIQRRSPVSEEELCKRMQAENMDALKDMFRTVSLREAESKRHNEIVEKVYNELDSKVPEFELPEEILEGETDKELRQLINQTVKSEADAEEFKKDMENHRAKAKELAKIKLRKMLILRNIAKLEDISVANEELEAQISIMSRYYGYKEDEFKRMIEQNGSLEDLRGDMLMSKVLDKLAQYADK